MNNEQHLTYELGITNVPSDATCDDNGLEESMGMVYADGEHRVIQQPVFNNLFVNGTLLFVHKIPGGETVNYISSNGTSILFNGNTTFPICAGDSNVQVTAIGKTLIICNDGSITYHLWKDINGVMQYKNLGTLPTLDVEFYMRGVSTEINRRGIGDIASVYQANNSWQFAPIEDKQAAFNDIIVGLYAENKNKINKKNGFCRPFFAVAAIEMYDGSYTRITNPILLRPSCRYNSLLRWKNDDYNRGYIDMLTNYCTMEYMLKTDLNEFEDIVKGITVFVTEGVEMYNTSADQPAIESNSTSTYTEGYYYKASASETPTDSKHRTEQYDNSGDYVYFAPPMESRNFTLINADLAASSVLYRLFDMKLNMINQKVSVNQHYAIGEALQNLTTQKTLDIVDYYTNTNLMAKKMMTYNNRLLLSNLKRSFFEGFSYFTPIGNNEANGATYDIYVDIETNTGVKVVKHTLENWKYDPNNFFFYPDTRARYVTIFKNQEPGNKWELEESQGFGGAWIKPYVTINMADMPTPTIVPSQPSSYVYPEPEQLINSLALSEVNNPFAFNASGYYDVGTSEIIGISPLTQALSQGQFGQYPLIVFTGDGIWAMSIANTGYFSAAHPMSREVCNNDKSITQTDGAIFFSSNKGLMMVVGNDVKCVSEQLRGKLATSAFSVGTNPDFVEFLKTAFIAYDYRDSLLWLFDGHRENGVTVGSRCCWIYNIKSGTFAHYDFKMYGPITNAVNNYPDYLLQHDQMIFSLLNRPDINHDGTPAPNRYTGTIITRTMKLGNGLTLKNIMQMRNIYDINDGGLSVQIFAKNDLNSAWTQLTHLRGTPWKYYQLRYTFSNLKATDRFAGTVLITQERRTNKLR